jgi:predicted esterase
MTLAILRRRYGFPAFLFILCLVSVGAVAQEPADPPTASESVPPTRADVIAVLDAPTDEKAAELIAGLIERGIEPHRVAQWLAQGRDYRADAPTGLRKVPVECADGKLREHFAWIPPTYTPARKHFLFVDLHGGVSRPQMIPGEAFFAPNPDGQAMIDYMPGRVAMEHGGILLVPRGQAGATWWDNVGVGGVMDAIAQLKRQYNIDENRIFVGGFSDGASGSYYLALTHNTPFAGFVPLSGHPAVPQSAAGLQIHLHSLRNKPMYAVNADRDSLYPASSIEPIVEAMREIGVPVRYRTQLNMTHWPGYVPTERATIWEWMQESTRDPYPRELVWQTADEKFSGLHWLHITEIGDVGNNQRVPDANAQIMSGGRIILGIQIDQEYAGKGVKVSLVTDDSVAAAMGMKAGDIIIDIDGAPIGTIDDLRTALGGKTHGDTIRVVVDRPGTPTESAEMPLTGEFPEARPVTVFSRTKLAASINATLDGWGENGNTITVTCDNVAQFKLLLSPQTIDFERPVTVVVNGDALEPVTVKPDIAVMLRHARKDLDRTMIYAAELVVDVPKGEKQPAKEEE